MVVTDPNGTDAYVIMGLDQYEDLVDSSCHGHFADGEDDWEPPFGDEEEDVKPEWNPEMDGDLISVDQEPAPHGDELGKTPAPAEQIQQDDLPKDLREAVEHDLAILESWRKEKESEPKTNTHEQKVSEKEQKNDDEEDRFYLEPIE